MTEPGYVDRRHSAYSKAYFAKLDRLTRNVDLLRTPRHALSWSGLRCAPPRLLICRGDQDTICQIKY